jgi:hypothetical protein
MKKLISFCLIIIVTLTSIVSLTGCTNPIEEYAKKQHELKQQEYNDSVNVVYLNETLIDFVEDYKNFTELLINDELDFFTINDNVRRISNLTEITEASDIKPYEEKNMDVDTKYVYTKKNIIKIFDAYLGKDNYSLIPEQKGFSYWYSYECGIIVVAPDDATVEKLNEFDADGKTLKNKNVDSNIKWVNISK